MTTTIMMAMQIGINQEDARKVLLMQVEMSREIMGSNSGTGKNIFLRKISVKVYDHLSVEFVH